MNLHCRALVLLNGVGSWQIRDVNLSDTKCYSLQTEERIPHAAPPNFGYCAQSDSDVYCPESFAGEPGLQPDDDN
jgi:hypothetical protein